MCVHSLSHDLSLSLSAILLPPPPPPLSGSKIGAPIISEDWGARAGASERANVICERVR